MLTRILTLWRARVVLIALIGTASDICHAILWIITGIGGETHVLTLTTGHIAKVDVAARNVSIGGFVATIVEVASTERDIRVI
jgi:hypothetical protein